MSSYKEIFMHCSMLKSDGDIGHFILKGKQPDIVANVAGFDFEEEDGKVILQRCEHTQSFPNDLPFNAQERYALYMKDIKQVDIFEAK